MTIYQAAHNHKQQYPNETVAILYSRMSNGVTGEAIDYTTMPGRWTFDQCINHNPVRKMWESRGLSIESGRPTAILGVV